MYRLAYLFFALCIATVLWFGWYVQSTISPMTASVIQSFLGTPPPPTVSVLLGFTTSEGRGIEIYDTETKTKLSILTHQAPAKPLGGEGAITSLIDPTEHDFARRYLRAQLDPKRAYMVTVGQVMFQNTPISVEYFRTNQDRNWALGEVRSAGTPIVFLAMHKGDPVEPAAIEKLLSLMKVPQ